MSRPFDLSLYLVTDRALCAQIGLVETVQQAVFGGATLVQLRDPHASTRELMADALALRDILRARGVPLIINDRVDVALAVDADGVHLGQDDMPARDARALLGPDRIIGLSIGTPQELEASADALAVVDYIGIGPIRGTSTKAGAGAAIGVEGFRAVYEKAGRPAVAIGGLKASDIPELLSAGASGVAVVSAICGTPDPAQAARVLATAAKR